MESDLDTRQTFEMGEWRVQPSAGLLSRGEVEHHLRPQVMDLLVTLAGRPAEVLSKGDLLDSVWGQRFVSESALTTAIAELREALADDPKEPRYIQTVPKRGYRFVGTIRVPADSANGTNGTNGSTRPIAAAVVEPDAGGPEPPVAANVDAPETTATHRPGVETSAPARKRMFALAALGLLAAVAAVGWRAARTDPSVPQLEVPITLAAGERWPDRAIHLVSLSPDGGTLVYVVETANGRHLVRRDLRTRQVTPLAGTAGAAAPFFSPDDGWIGFWQNGALRRLSLDGESVATMAEAMVSFGATVRVNSDLVYSPTYRSGLMVLPAGDHSPRSLSEPTFAGEEFSHRWPDAIAGSRFVLFSSLGARTSQIEAIDVVSRQRHVVVEGATFARFAAPEHLVFARDRTLMAARFDPQSARIIGTEFEVARDLAQGTSGIAQFAVSATGVLAFLTAAPRAERELVLVDRMGRVTPLPAPAQPYIHPRISADGTQVALWIEAEGKSDIWTYDLGTSALVRRTTSGGSRRATWAPNGRRLAFDAPTTATANAFTLSLESGGMPELVVGRDRYQEVEDWLPDGKSVVMAQVEPDTASDLHIVNLDTRGTHPLANKRGAESGAAVSPDGRWVAYVWTGASPSAEEFGVYVVSASGDETTRVRVAARGREPRWSRDGRELFFREGQAMYSIPIVATQPGLTVGAPVELFRGDFEIRPAARANYDVMRDGRFLMLRQRGGRSSQEIILSLNWRDAATRTSRDREGAK